CSCGGLRPRLLIPLSVGGIIPPRTYSPLCLRPGIFDLAMKLMIVVAWRRFKLHRHWDAQFNPRRHQEAPDHHRLPPALTFREVGLSEYTALAPQDFGHLYVGPITTASGWNAGRAARLLQCRACCKR